jgi:hypothetical protein
VLLASIATFRRISAVYVLPPFGFRLGRAIDSIYSNRLGGLRKADYSTVELGIARSHAFCPDVYLVVLLLVAGCTWRKKHTITLATPTN